MFVIVMKFNHCNVNIIEYICLFSRSNGINQMQSTLRGLPTTTTGIDLSFASSRICTHGIPYELASDKKTSVEKKKNIEKTETVLEQKEINRKKLIKRN